MNRNFSYLVYMVLLVMISSCTPFQYVVEYHTHLSNSEPKSLVYKDTLFVFEFHPVPNGLYFNISNLSNLPATIVWNSCYFIDPSGNPSRALDIDGIIEDTRTREMANNESIIPPNGSYGRFTTSALNVQAIETDYTNYYYFKSFGNSFTTSNTFFEYGRYWPEYRGPVFAPADSLHKNDLALPGISSYVRDNNNMGIGFCLRVKDTTINYKFDFKISRIEIFKVRDTITPPELAFYTVDTSDWSWQKAPLNVPVLLLPKNGVIIDSVSVKLKWSKPIGATSSAVQVASDSLFRSIIIQDTSKIIPSKSIFRLKTNCVYYWRVAAKYSSGKSDWSAPYSFVYKGKK